MQPAVTMRSRDAIALTMLAGIHFFLLGKYGIYDWKDNDGFGYYYLAQQLREVKTWLSVPDLHDPVSLSLLRLPLYSLLIIAAQDIFGRFWMQAIVAAQMAALLYANFILYRAVTLFSGLWIMGVASACLFALTPVSHFERFVLTDTFVMALFTVIICNITMMIFVNRYLTRTQMWAIGAAFAALFLLREANPLFAIVLAPLVLAAVVRGQRIRASFRIYGPMFAIILIVGLWNVYRVGSFVITTGASFNPALALYQADKIDTILDQDNPIDRAIKEEMKQFTFPELLQINERLKRELNIGPPELSRLFTKRYLSAWLHHPETMARHVGDNWQRAKMAFVLDSIYDDNDIPAGTRDAYLGWSRQLLVWAVTTCPLLCIVLGVLVPFLRRQAWIAGCMWAFSASVFCFYGAMYFEVRYLLPVFGAVLMIVGLSCGVVLRLAEAAIMAILRLRVVAQTDVDHFMSVDPNHGEDAVLLQGPKR